MIESLNRLRDMEERRCEFQSVFQAVETAAALVMAGRAQEAADAWPRSPACMTTTSPTSIALGKSAHSTLPLAYSLSLSLALALALLQPSRASPPLTPPPRHRSPPSQAQPLYQPPSPPSQALLAVPSCLYRCSFSRRSTAQLGTTVARGPASPGRLRPSCALPMGAHGPKLALAPLSATTATLSLAEASAPPIARALLCL